VEPPPPPEPGTSLAQQLRDLTTARYSEAMLSVFDLMLVFIDRVAAAHAYLTDALADYAALRLRLLAAPDDAAPAWATAQPAHAAATVAVALAPLEGLLASEQHDLVAVDAALAAWARSAAPVDPQTQQTSEDVVHAVCEMTHIRAARLLAIRREVRQYS
jgi:hypothetical protein